MWQPISRAEFEDLSAEERLNFADATACAFEQFAVPVYTATIRRSEQCGNEHVFVVADSPKGAIYYDDVEEGFNFSPIDLSGHILHRGGSQMNLADAVESWLVPQLK